MAKKDIELHIRVNSEDKKKAEEIVSSMGLTLSKVVELCIKQIIIRREIPFSITAGEMKGEDGQISGLSKEGIEAAEGFGGVFN